MQDTIEALYYGEITPHEQLTPQTEDYQERMQTFTTLREQFQNQLSDVQRKELTSLLDAQVAMLSCEVAQSFVDGFKLGARLLTETFYKEDQ